LTLSCATSSVRYPGIISINQPARHGRGGFCVCGVAVALEAAPASTAGNPERGGGEAGAGPAAPERGAPGYGPRWRRARAAFLAEHPLCAACQALGRVVPATVVDHVVPHRGDQRLFWDQSNWAPACKRCHDAKTAREGRWG